MISESTTISLTPRLAQWNLNNATTRLGAQLPPGDIRDLIRAHDDLPPLPEITARLLRFRDDPNASAVGLAAIVELDPLLTGQMLRWANSAYYGLRIPAESVRDAIVRSLGFSTALALALALAALRPLKTPNQGSIGRDRVWRHGLQCGLLMTELAKHLPAGAQTPSEQIPLAGLTQNIGYLLLGHLLPDSFRFLNHLIEQNGSLTHPVIDRFGLGLEHTQLGQWLFEVWEMPPALRAVVRHHHNPGYEGEHAPLVLLTCLADSLLDETPWRLGACAIEKAARSPLIARLGLDQETCEMALEKIRTPEE
ncbi:HDOD domain-containing protein [Thiorhodococcus mannitoliphagus]|uniref:HDOD domain-containing protein n=1 Tax=Thiorhodococcus mannitoliphagus TaxID=329406 RepID=A0A6P1DYP3_9GAMM|nr:HDOD domain-containing protein [Thiorhodococcus mannitoliphagus]NEX23447.1 HDOD domain-containing protein [Thiorhodococcus mannitoliphagus]